MSDINLYRCKPRLLREFALDCLYAGLVPFIQGSPGVGKSAIVRSIAKELNLFLIDHRLSTSPPEDMSGLPAFRDGYAYFAPFRELFPLRDAELPTNPETGKKYDGWLIFLDEFNSAKKDTQAAAYKLILDRMVGQHHLHDNCLMMCAGNLATDRAIVNPLSTAMQSRVIHLELVHDFDEWLEDVAFIENYDERIIAYLSQYRDKLMDFRPNHSDRTFCCPRTWEFMDRLIQGKEVEDRKVALYAGTITSGVAADFTQFCQVYKDLPNAKDIIKTPESYPMPQSLNMKWAIVTSLLTNVNKDTLENIAIYVDRMDVSFRVLFYRSVMIRNPDLRHFKAFTNALVQLQRYLKG